MKVAGQLRKMTHEDAWQKKEEHVGKALVLHCHATYDHTHDPPQVSNSREESKCFGLIRSFGMPANVGFSSHNNESSSYSIQSQSRLKARPRRFF